MSVSSVRISFALACLATPALAEVRDNTTIGVDASDLDLTTIKGQARLDNRVKAAARSICHSGLRSSSAWVAEKRCMETAMASAQPQVDLAIANANSSVRTAAISVAKVG
jgi:UrcA family protein